MVCCLHVRSVANGPVRYTVDISGTFDAPPIGSSATSAVCVVGDDDFGEPGGSDGNKARYPGGSDGEQLEGLAAGSTFGEEDCGGCVPTE